MMTTVTSSASPASSTISQSRRIPPNLYIGIGGLALIIIVAVVAPILWTHAANTGTTDIRAGASARHWFGTDSQGRDILVRTLVATRLTVIMALIATAIAAVLGCTIGAAVVIAGPRVTWLGERAIDLWIAFPPIIVALAVTAIFQPGEVTVVVAIGIAFSPQFARLTNTLARSVSQKDFVITSHLLGVRAGAVLRRHIVPNIVAPSLVLTSVCVSGAILTLSGLSFLGLGVQPPAIDWGQLLASGIRDLYENPAEALAPSLAIVVTGLSASLIGEGLVLLNEPRRPFRGRNRASIAHAAAVAQPVDANEAAQRDATLIARDLYVQVGDDESSQKLVHGVSLIVGAGEVVGLVGESGSGKTLTAMAAAHLTPPELHWTASTLRVAGHELCPGAKVPSSLALDLGVVFQDPSSCFNPARKLGPQLIETLRVHKKVNKREAERLAIQKLDEARVTFPESRLRQYPHELSGGMRQRAMIAMALLGAPRLLIADEPTTALDVTVQADVLRLIKQINVEQSMSILLISHDIDVVTAMCDRVYVMYRGDIVEHLTADELRTGKAAHPYTQTLLNASSSTELSRATRETGASERRPAISAVHAVAPIAGRDPAPALLAVCNVSASYGASRQSPLVLRDVSLTLGPGKTMGVVGESGSGKSTLAKAVVGLLRPSSGSITIEDAGQDKVNGTGRRMARRAVQMVPQDPYLSLDPRMTVGKTLLEALAPNASNLSAHRDRIVELLQMVSLDATAITRLPHEFSGGQRQRIAIARAIAVQPRLLIADEVTSSLDATIQLGILSLLDELQRRLGFGCILITHNLGVAARMCDEITVLRHGRVIEQGSIEILRNPADDYTRQLVSSVPDPYGHFLQVPPSYVAHGGRQ